MKKLVRSIYAFKFLDDLVLIYPLYAVMFTEFGMQAWQVSALFLTWSLTSFFLEIPSGAWADKYDRKKILFLGQCIRALGYLCWLCFPTFAGFMAGFVCWGIKSALTSGTFQALVYDELKYYGQEDKFAKIWGRTQTLSFIASLIASLLASPAILVGYPFVLILSSLAVLLSGIVIIRINVKAVHFMNSHVNYFSILREGWNNAFNNRLVFRLILLYALVIALNGGLDEYWPIFTREVGIPVYGLGIVLGMLSLGEALGSFLAHYFEKKRLTFIYWLTFSNGLLLLVSAYFYKWPVLLLIFVFSFIVSLIQVLLESRLHHAIPDETRATVSSINGFLTELMVMGVFGGFGLLSQMYNYQIAFLCFGGIILLAALIYLSGQNHALSDKSGQKRTER